MEGAEASLSKALLSSVIESPDRVIIFALDREFRYLGFNRAHIAEMKRVYGADIELGETVLDYIPRSDDRDKALENYARVLQGERFVRVEKYGLGDHRSWYELYFNPLLDAEDSITGFTVFVVDVTARKLAEEQFRCSEANFADVLDNSRDLLYKFNLQTQTYDYLSPALESMVGYSVEDYTQGGLEFAVSLMHPEDKLSHNAHLAELSRGEVSGEFAAILEYRLKHRELGYRWFSDNRSIVCDGEGKPTAIIGNCRDITESKLAEEEQRNFERKLLHTQKLESLGVLAGGIAHDFNNLLMVTLGNVGLALSDLPPLSPVRGKLLNIEQASKRAAELANQMLAYSGKGNTVVEQIDLEQLVAEMTHLLEVTVSKKILLRLDFAENLSSFMGDATQLRQVILNLITNASEAIGEDRGIIALSTGSMYCDRAYLDTVNETLQAMLGEPLSVGDYSYFEVSDTGSGMDAATIEKIFDPFYSTKFTGRGLGMSAVLGILRGHKAAMTIDSESGKGTIFRVLFPAKPEESKDVILKPNSDTRDLSWCGSGTVLIVDDEEAVLSIGQKMLACLGYRVVTAIDGERALDMLREQSEEIVCVLLDMTMPNLDGRQTFQLMKQIDPDVTVVLCSGFSESECAAAAWDEGPVDFLHKPYSLDRLGEVMKSLSLGEGGARPASTDSGAVPPTLSSDPQ